MKWPKGYKRPDFDVSEARVRQWLIQSVKANARNTHNTAKKKIIIERLRSKVVSVTTELANLKRKIAVEKGVEGLRFVRGDAKFYWGALSYMPLRSLLKAKKLTPAEFQLLMLAKYHKFITTEDAVVWFISFSTRELRACVTKGLFHKSRVGRGRKYIYTPTEYGESVIGEYCKMISKYLNAQLKLKNELDSEKAKLRESKQRTAKVRGVPRGVP